jgi:hypothetical protein
MDAVDALVLACGDTPAGVEDAVRVGRRPGKDEVDPLLDALDGRRLVVAGTDADLAAVALRLLRTERLGTVTVGVLPTPESALAEAYGLPMAPDQALRLALQGDPDPVPLIRDDTGGVLVGRGLLVGLRGVAYCDDDRVLRGTAARLEVTPDPGASPDTSVNGLVVRVTSAGLFRRGVTESTGRAVQIGCAPTRPISDGVEHDRSVTRWTWYRHTEDLRLVRGLI